MPRKKTKVRRRADISIEKWQLNYLLTGDDFPTDSFEKLSWDFVATWHEFKNSEPIKKWKKKNGLTFFEKNHKEYL